jgi:hypothetical protein
MLSLSLRRAQNQCLSGLSNKFLYVLIRALQFVPSIAWGEGPVHGFAGEIASVSPRQHFVTYSVSKVKHIDRGHLPYATDHPL